MSDRGPLERQRDHKSFYRRSVGAYATINKPGPGENEKLSRGDRMELARRNVPLVLYVIRSLLRMNPVTQRVGFDQPRIGFGRDDRDRSDDYIQDGIIGLIRAAEGYDPERGLFSTYAIPWIIDAVASGNSRQRTVRVPPTVMRATRQGDEQLTESMLEAARLALNEYENLDRIVHSDSDTGHLDQPLRLRDTIPDREVPVADNMIAKDALDSLTPIERRVIEHRYGIVGPPLDLQSTGRRLGLERIEVRRIERAAMKKMQAAT